MTEVSFYKCDVCGEDFDNEYECRCHENSHRNNGVLENENIKFYANGKRVTTNKDGNLYAFRNKIDAIEVTDSEMTQEINSFYREAEYTKPFENINSKRVYFDDYLGKWIDADKTIANIEAKFGE